MPRIAKAKSEGEVIAAKLNFVNQVTQAVEELRRKIGDDPFLFSATAARAGRRRGRPPGRPKGSRNKSSASSAKPRGRKRRKITDEERASAGRKQAGPLSNVPD